MGSESLRFIIKARDEASRVLHGIGSGFSKLGTMAKAGMAVAAVGVGLLIAAITALVGFVLDAKRAYEGWMQTLDDMQDVTGMSAKSVSLLAFQARLADTDVGALTRGVGIFTKVLDAARRGADASLSPFRRLGVSLRDQNGQLRPLSEVLSEVRDRLSLVKDQVTRNAIAAQLFGRGFKELADWLDKSKAKMREYVRWAEELGMVMGKKSMDAFQEYRENQRKMSVGWDAFKINAYGALVPLINDLMPGLIKVVWKAADWMSTFRKAVEKKGWDRALREMVPAFAELSDKAKEVLGWLKENLPKAFAWLKENGPTIANALARIAKWLDKTGDSGSRVGKVFTTVRKVLGLLNPMLGLATGAFGNIWSILGKVWNAAKTVIGWLGSLKNVLSSGFNTGPLGAVYSAISSIISVAQTAYAWIQKVLNSKGNMSSGGGGGGGGGSFGGRALGGAVYASAAGDPYTLHGRETVVAHKDPSRGLRDLADSGIIGGGTQVLVYLDSEPIAARIQVRQRQQARRFSRTLGVSP